MKLKIWAAALLCMVLFMGCGGGRDVASEPVSDGFFGEGQLVQGGALSDAPCEYNLKSVKSAREMNEGEEEIHLSLRFLNGSRMMGSVQEQEGAGVPPYTIYTLFEPARLVVELDALSYWDYRRAPDFEAGTVHGVLQHMPVTTSRISLYFHLDEPVRFVAEAHEDTLLIRLKSAMREDAMKGDEGEALEAPAGKRYFVTANAYDAYRTGALPSETELTPVLAHDMQNALMISAPLNSEEEAATKRAELSARYAEIDRELWHIVALSYGEWPVYDASLEHIAAAKKPVVRLIGGEERTLPVLAPDGLYLCELPDQSGFLYSREFYPEGEEDGAYQQLYMALENGQVRPATWMEFGEIDQARFSPDGRKLALLERAGESTHLYIFDANTYELLNDLSEMGFGSNIGAFIWNDLGNTIYAVAGASDMQLHAFDYSIPNEQERHSVVDRGSADEGALGYRDGELYFAQSAMEKGSMIYRIKPEGGVRKPFIEGGNFAVSDDARYMAVSKTSEDGVGGAQGAFFIYDFQTGDQKHITSDFYPYDFIWSRDCTKLYYIESRVAGGKTEQDSSNEQDGGNEEGDDTQDVVEDAFAYTLWVYDLLLGQNEKLLDMAAPDLFPSPYNIALYLDLNVGEGKNHIRASYRLDLNTVFDAAEQDGEKRLEMGE